MIIKHLENKIRLVGIICTAFLVGCVIISVSSIWTARTMVSDAQKKVYVLDGNVPILVNRTTMDSFQGSLSAAFPFQQAITENR